MNNLISLVHPVGNDCIVTTISLAYPCSPETGSPCDPATKIPLSGWIKALRIGEDHVPSTRLLQTCRCAKRYKNTCSHMLLVVCIFMHAPGFVLAHGSMLVKSDEAHWAVKNTMLHSTIVTVVGRYVSFYSLIVIATHLGSIIPSVTQTTVHQGLFIICLIVSWSYVGLMLMQFMLDTQDKTAEICTSYGFTTDWDDWIRGTTLAILLRKEAAVTEDKTVQCIMMHHYIF